MNILIVEDETAAYENLAAMLTEIDPSIHIMANTESVDQTVKWLTHNETPDLIFMDIQLSDGISFSIFDLLDIETPIVFTTAYDEYALQAFKVNSIDYLLKPIKSEELEAALRKFNRQNKTEMREYLERVLKLAPLQRQKERILIPVKDKLMPVLLNRIAYFYTTDKSTTVCLTNGEIYPHSKTLEQTIKTLNSKQFYRANKQFIISRESIVEITVWFDNRLRITLQTPTPENIYISKNRAAEFKEWMVCS